MKGKLSIILALFIVACPCVLIAQSKKVKIYAYQQDVLPGVRQITIDESGQTHEVPRKNAPRTFLYVEAPRSKNMEAKHVWIDGKPYGVRISTPTLPVVIHNMAIMSKPADTLVRKSENLVIQLEPIADAEPFSPSAKAKKKMKSNRIVLHTIENGKHCYYYHNSIKILDPVALQ